jgi:HSP20 family protein
MLRDWMTRTEYPTYTGYEWYPTIDVSESDKDFQVRAEIPGVDPKDVDISVDENHNLIIAGEKRQEEEKEGRDWYRVERSYGTFRRSISLPVETDTTKVRATSRDGVITITVPKDGERKRRKVEIQTT